MLLASLGLHGLVLFSPVAPSEEDLVPPPDPEEDGIAITKIDAPQPRSRAEVPANTGTVKTARPTQTPAASVSPQATQARAANTAATAAARASSAPRQRRAPAASTRTSDTRTARTSQPTVPDLSSVGDVQNPNTSAPSVVVPGNQTTAAAAPARDNPFDDYVEVFAAYNGVSISEEEANNLRQSWLDSFSDRGAAFTNLEIQPLNDLDPLPYDANICLPSPPEAAQVLVMVDAEGKLDEYKQFIQRTGYRNFDEEAVELIEQYDFPSAASPQAYLAEVNVAYDAEECDWPPAVERIPDDYFAVLNNYVGPELTTISDFRAARSEWLSQLGESEDLGLPSTDNLEAVEFEGFDQEVPYPLEICLPIEPVDARWGVVVNSDGTINGDPEPLRSTGYQNFDERSQELVENFAFPETETPQIYVVEVPIGYNPVNCQGLDSDEFKTSSATTVSITPGATSGGTSSGRQLPDNDRAVPTFANSNQPQRGLPIPDFNSGEPDLTISRLSAVREDFVSGAASNTVSPRSSTATRPDSGGAFNPERQAHIVDSGRESVEAAAVGGLNNSPELAALSLDTGWPEAIERGCFLSELNEANFAPVDHAADAIILSESLDFVPITLSRLYGVEVADAGEYCAAPLLEMKANGVPQLFASTIAFGAGNSNALVVIWLEDPR